MDKTKKLPAPTTEKMVRDPAVLSVGNEYLTQREQEKIDKTVDSPERQQEALDEVIRAAQARAMTQPEVRAASIIRAFDRGLDINHLAEEMREQSAEILKWNMARADAMQIAQAHTLDAIFSNLSWRARGNMEAGYSRRRKRICALRYAPRANVV